MRHPIDFQEGHNIIKQRAFVYVDPENITMKCYN